MEMVENVMSLYGIKPVEFSKITDRVYKVMDGQHQYSLKKSILSPQTLKEWEQVFHQADQKHITEILSIVLTKDHSIYTIYENELYYLMPWIDGERSTIEQLYRSIGKVHKKTQQFQSVDYDKMVYHFNQYSQYCDDVQKRLLTDVKQFESHIYMSPLELQVCTHYRDIELAIKKAQEQIRKLTSSQEKREEWGYCLCHGNLRLSHSLVDVEHTYLINWEQAHYNYPMVDLSKLLKNELTTYDAPTKLWMNMFKVYMEENRLHNDELSLLLIHLLDPTIYIQNIEQYIDRTSNQSMMNQIKKIQIEHRKLLFGLQFLDFIDQQYFSQIDSEMDH